MTQPPSNSEVTMTNLPHTTVPNIEEKSMKGEITLTTAWKAPKDSVLIFGQGTPDEEWVRVTDSVGNGPYQVTVTRLTTSQRWSARLRYHLKNMALGWKCRVWWPVVDGLEDAVRFLGESWRRRV